MIGSIIGAKQNCARNRIDEGRQIDSSRSQVENASQKRPKDLNYSKQESLSMTLKVD